MSRASAIIQLAANLNASGGSSAERHYSSPSEPCTDTTTLAYSARALQSSDHLSPYEQETGASISPNFAWVPENFNYLSPHEQHTSTSTSPNFAWAPETPTYSSPSEYHTGASISPNFAWAPETFSHPSPYQHHTDVTTPAAASRTSTSLPQLTSPPYVPVRRSTSAGPISHPYLTQNAAISVEYKADTIAELQIHAHDKVLGWLSAEQAWVPWPVSETESVQLPKQADVDCLMTQTQWRVPRSLLA